MPPWSDYYIKEAINFIEQNFQNDISIEDVAAVCGINRSYLGRIFRTSTGHSPQEFLIHYRMTKAAELLKLTTLSIGDIGSAVGYENALHIQETEAGVVAQDVTAQSADGTLKSVGFNF